MVLTLAVLLTAGCRSIGPDTVRRDQMHYSTAVADSWKEQLLLNIVRTRFGDAPAFMEVSSVVSGYTLETGVNLGGQFSPESLRGDSFAGGGVSGKYTDRPTISYSPMTGERYARSLMAPVPLEVLIFVMQGGAPADFILGLTTQSIEGKQNLSVLDEQVEAANPQFTRLLELLRSFQRANVIDFDITSNGDGIEIWLQFDADSSSPVGPEQMAEARSLLGVPAQTDRVKLVFGTRNPEPGVVAIRTRSLLQILATLGASVQIPKDHPAHEHSFLIDPSLAPRGFMVRSGMNKPAESFVAVPYEGLWFWIDRRDLDSKTTLTIVTLLFNVLEGGSKTSPILTIPTN
jgi:hypothetical protein